MPQYRIDDLPDFLNVPLEALARAGQQLTDAEAKERVGSALHEGAHLLAALCYDAPVSSVTVTPTGRDRRRHPQGSVAASERTVSEAAVISYVGHAWEEMHGDPARAVADLLHGSELARQPECDKSSEDLLEQARWFVREGDEAIRVVAAALLATMPKSGVLTGSALRQFVGYFFAVMRGPERHHSPAPASRLQRR